MSSAYRYWKPHEDVVPPPPPTPAAVVRGVGVKITTGLTRRTLEDWRQEILAWWRGYFGDVGIQDRAEEMLIDHAINLDEDEEDLIHLL